MGLWVGRDFPNHNELQYTNGILKYHQETAGSRAKYPVTIINMFSKEHSKFMDFYCNYSAYMTIGSAECLSKQEILPYLNKQEKIGYYYQKDFLWFSNPNPQLVSLHIDNKIIHSYQDTTNNIQSSRKSFWYFHGVFGIIGLALFIFSDYHIKKPL